MVPARRPHTSSSQATFRGDAHEHGDFSMKKLSIVTAAIFLGLGGIAMAGNDNADSQQSNMNATGPNPYMTFSGTTFRDYRAPGYGAFASYPVPHHVVHHHVKK
jgi:hypothetical protein